MTRDAGRASDFYFLSGGGDMGRLMRAFAWTATPLGAPGAWPQSLRSALGICLGSGFPIGLYWGPDLALLYNDAWSPILGTKHPWALGRGAREVWPEIWDTIGPLFDLVLTTGEATYSEDQLLPMRRHGYTEECYFNYTFSPIRGESGAVEGIFNAVVETTYRVIGERRTRLLRELGERTATARSPGEACTLAAATLGAAPLDVPFAALYLVDEGARGARLAGCSGVEAGSPAAPAFLPLDRDAPWPIARARRRGRVEVVTGLADRLGVALPGGPWPEPAHTALVAPIVTGAGLAGGFLVAGVSPRRAIDEEYRQFVEGAASHVATAVASATAYEAERARAEALAEIDRAKTVFFSNVSHEFRTPLTLMLGPLEDALAAPAPALAGESLALVHRNALRLLRLVNALLDFSRIEAGRAEASYQPTDLARLTAELASAFEPAMARAGLAFTVDCPALPEPVFVDHDMWEKIVLNLVSNALKFTFAGAVRVAIRARGDDVEMTVADTGTGIAAEELPRLFERFHRGKGTPSRTHEGSGIGLALVHELVRLHGGSIRAESEPGRGTTFTVTIPRGAAHLPADRVAAARALAKAATGAAPYVEEALRWLPEALAPAISASAEIPSEILPGARVLVADDNADMRAYVERVLGARFRVEAVGDGAAALAAARRERPDSGAHRRDDARARRLRPAPRAARGGAPPRRPGDHALRARGRRGAGGGARRRRG
ncbi:MAG: ATP-binding protein [Minicystis sp.]